MRAVLDTRGESEPRKLFLVTVIWGWGRQAAAASGARVSPAPSPLLSVALLAPPPASRSGAHGFAHLHLPLPFSPQLKCLSVVGCPSKCAEPELWGARDGPPLGF